MKISSALLALLKTTLLFVSNSIVVSAINDDYDGVRLQDSHANEKSDVDTPLMSIGVHEKGIKFRSKKLNDYSFFSKKSTGITVGDLNNDGLMDIVMGKTGVFEISGSNMILFKQNHGYRYTKMNLPKLIPDDARDDELNENSASFAIADFNNDGLMDIATPSDHMTNPNKLYLNQGDGKFDASYLPALGGGYGGYTSVFAADMNNDGLIDIVLSDYVIGILWNEGNGQFTPERIAGQTDDFDFYVQCPAAVGDVNNDGFPDIVLSIGQDVRVGTNESYQIKNQLVMNNGDGTFEEAIDLPGGYPDRVVPNLAIARSLVLTDVNNDGMLDIIAAYEGREENKNQVLMNNGDGTFGDVYDLPKKEGRYDYGTLIVGDMNNDGFVDLVTFDSYWLDVLLNNGDGTFGNPVELRSPQNVNGACIADLNNDGMADIVFGRYGRTIAYINESGQEMSSEITQVE